VAHQLHASVYNDLYTFFSRYYQDGDIFSRPRRGKVEIPFTGNEDVVLQWANRDQYYIKTGEQFKSYRFKVDDAAVEFALRNVTAEQNNNRGEKRYFVLAKESAKEPAISFDDETKRLTVSLEYRPLTDKEKGTYGKTEVQKPQENLNTAAVTAIVNRVKEPIVKGRLAQPIGEGKPPLLLYHLARFTRKNSTDFFIHKDLSGFLQRELDDFLKTEVIRGDELLTIEHPEVSRHALLRAQVVRHIAENIIDFLAQVENFQKRLFEKRKFIVRSEYCITLDRLPESLWGDVLKNKAQLSEWQRLDAGRSLKTKKKRRNPTSTSSKNTTNWW
jgi:adenine-specific DNA-methyltransferase